MPQVGVPRSARISLPLKRRERPLFMSPGTPSFTPNLLIMMSLPVSHSPSTSEGDDDEVHSTISSSGPRNPMKKSSHKSILARLKTNRERRDVRGDRVDRFISLIEKIQHGTYVGRNEVILRQLFLKDYIKLLVEIDERDRDFQLFFN
ncbi:hypothetical protein F5Y12DRAFT_247063 [Xylaria sp. FL1777]|nr:hypothetical protein F5Y12DRAFT_247063 [Xylaria sp. FL1777]